MSAIVYAIRSMQSMIAQQQQKVLEQRREFHVVCKEVLNINAAVGDCEYLDVGGRQFHVTRAALCSHGDHFLSVPGSSVFQDVTDVHGNIFIDCDPTLFPCIVQYLREGVISVARYQEELRPLQREAIFYGMTELQQRIKIDAYLVAALLINNGVALHVLKRYPKPHG